MELNEIGLFAKKMKALGLLTAATMDCLCNLTSGSGLLIREWRMSKEFNFIGFS